MSLWSATFGMWKSDGSSIVLWFAQDNNICLLWQQTLSAKCAAVTTIKVKIKWTLKNGRHVFGPTLFGRDIILGRIPKTWGCLTIMTFWFSSPFHFLPPINHVDMQMQLKQIINLTKGGGEKIMSHNTRKICNLIKSHKKSIHNQPTPRPLHPQKISNQATFKNKPRRIWQRNE